MSFFAALSCVVVLSTYQNCSKDVGFDSRPSTDRANAQGTIDTNPDTNPSGPVTGGSGDVVIQLNERPLDNTLNNGDSFVDFAVTTPVGTITSVTCRLDGVLVACNPVDRIPVVNPGVGTHTFVIIGTRDDGKSAVEVITWDIYNQIVELTKDISVTTISDKVDIIINVDNSGSMEYEQTSMASRISSFMSKFEHLDYHIAVTTTSPIGGVWHSALDYVDGKFVTLSDGSHCIRKGVNSAQAQTLIQDSVVRDLYLKVDANGNNIESQQIPEGNGWERGIFTTYRSFERSNTPNTPEADCLRDNVAKHVILISDERETLTDNSGVFLNDVAKSDGSNLVNYVSNVFGPNVAFKFHSIIVNPYSPEGVSCLASHGNKSGVEFADLSLQTGGVIGSVCAADYASQLGVIGQTISDSNLSYPLNCVAVANGNDMGEVTDLSSGQVVGINHQFSGDKVEFAQLLPAGNYRVRYFCYQ